MPWWMYIILGVVVILAFMQDLEPGILSLILSVVVWGVWTYWEAVLEALMLMGYGLVLMTVWAGGLAACVAGVYFGVRYVVKRRQLQAERVRAAEEEARRQREEERAQLQRMAEEAEYAAHARERAEEAARKAEEAARWAAERAEAEARERQRKQLQKEKLRRKVDRAIKRIHKDLQNPQSIVSRLFREYGYLDPRRDWQSDLYNPQTDLHQKLDEIHYFEWK